MYSTIYLALTKKGRARVAKKKPTIKPDEICLKVTLDIPDQIFTKPQLEMLLKVDPAKVSSSVITPVIKDNIADIIKQQTGLHIKINIDPETFNNLKQAEKEEVLKHFNEL